MIALEWRDFSVGGGAWTLPAPTAPRLRRPRDSANGADRSPRGACQCDLGTCRPAGARGLDAASVPGLRPGLLSRRPSGPAPERMNGHALRLPELQRGGAESCHSRKNLKCCRQTGAWSQPIRQGSPVTQTTKSNVLRLTLAASCRTRKSTVPKARSSAGPETTFDPSFM